MLLVSYHSQSGTCTQFAQALLAGATTERDDVVLSRAVDTGTAEIAASDGFVLVCAENSGRLAGGAKDLLDRVFYPLHTRQVNLPYCLVISAGNDGRGAVEEARRILRGIPFTEATEPRIIRGAPTAADFNALGELGAAFAAGVSMGIF